MKFVGEGIGAGNQDAPERRPRPPLERTSPLQAAVEQRTENTVLGEMGELAQAEVQYHKCWRRDLEMKKAEEFAQQPGGKRAAVSPSRKREDHPRPGECDHPQGHRSSRLGFAASQASSWELPW